MSVGLSHRLGREDDFDVPDMQRAGERVRLELVDPKTHKRIKMTPSKVPHHGESGNMNDHCLQKMLEQRVRAESGRAMWLRIGVLGGVEKGTGGRARRMVCEREDGQRVNKIRDGCAYRRGERAGVNLCMLYACMCASVSV